MTAAIILGLLCIALIVAVFGLWVELHTERVEKQSMYRRLCEMAEAYNREHDRHSALARQCDGLVDMRVLAALCSLFMCSDPWPTTDEERVLIEKFLDRWSDNYGLGSWIEAYHKTHLKPASTVTCTECGKPVKSYVADGGHRYGNECGCSNPLEAKP